MVNAPNLGAAVAQAAQAVSSQLVHLQPSSFDITGQSISLPAHSSDPGAILLRQAATSLPTSLFADATPTFLSRIAAHLPALAKSPIVLHLATGADHSPVTSLFRAAGLVLLYSSTPEQAQRHVIVAAKIAKAGHGVVHWLDDSKAEAGKSLDSKALKKAKDWVAAELKVANGHSNGKANGKANGDSNGHHVEEKLSVDAVVDAAFASFPKLGSVAKEVKGGDKSAKNLIFALANETALEAIKADLPPSTSYVFLNLYRPLSADRLSSLVPAAVERVIVLEQSHSHATKWAPLFLDVLGGLNELSDRDALPKVVSRVLGSEVKDVGKELVAAVADDAGIEGPVIGEIIRQPAATPLATIPKHEQAYVKILEQLFSSRLDFANKPTAGETSTLPEYALGKLLGAQSARQVLQAKVKAFLAKPDAGDADLRRALSSWASSQTEAAATEVVQQLRKASTEFDQDIALFSRPSNWIVGSDAWAQDLGASGVHHLLASGVDANLLIIDAQPFPGVEAVADPERRGKKDIGLYAMNYGNAYVAAVAVYGDYSQAVRAMVEADRFKGPSVVLAYLPGGDDDAARALDVLKETKRAIDSGFWPLYRWDPSRADQATASWRKEGNEQDPFQLDSEKTKNDLRAFLDRQNHLTMLSRSTPLLSKDITSSYGGDVAAARQSRALSAFQQLSGAVDGPPLLILYASDGGNAEKMAKKLSVRARARGLGARVEVMDEVAIDDLALEPNVALVTSTAGQGEFPQNGRKFWKALQEVNSAATAPTGAESKFDAVRFSVFAMGDSHYWPRPEDSKYYNKSGRDLDAKLEMLGAQRMSDLGLGDDQDPDGAMTAYKLWEPLLYKALGVGDIDVVEAEPEPITNEHIKIASNYLRGTIAEGLADKSTGALAESDGQLTKFHGIYQQDDRDIRDDRKEQGLEPAYSFMVRVRMPAGVCRPDQWLQIDDISDRRGNQTFKLTTRQTFQFHGIVKGNLKPAIQEINKAMLDTIAACGDVHRNVMCTANPSIGTLHKDVFDFSKGLSEHLLPHTSAYSEIWLDKKLVAGEAVKDFEPLYGSVYLPRKFKINVAVPPNNDVDVYTADVGFIAIRDETHGGLAGFNVTIGGGMGVTHSNKKTYPRLGDVIGFVPTDKGFDVAEKIMTTQRDNGDRTNRKHARMKYTVDDMGLDNFKAEVEKRLGYKLEPARPFEFTHNTDNFGWEQGDDGNWHFCAFIENGRVQDEPGKPFKTCMKEIAKIHTGVFRLTPNQHVIVADVTPEQKPKIEELLKTHHLDKTDFTGLRLSSSACVAFPTCGLAMAESERYLPLLVDRVEKICEDAGLRNDAIVMRMTGCPNGCARPYAAEVAFVGKAPQTYAMYLGGGHYGERLNKIYKETIEEHEIVDVLTPMIRLYAKQRIENEKFGDFCIRQGWISPTKSGLTFYDGMAPTHPPISA